MYVNVCFFEEEDEEKTNNDIGMYKLLSDMTCFFVYMQQLYFWVNSFFGLNILSLETFIEKSMTKIKWAQRQRHKVTMVEWW